MGTLILQQFGAIELDGQFDLIKMYNFHVLYFNTQEPMVTDV